MHRKDWAHRANKLVRNRHFVAFHRVITNIVILAVLTAAIGHAASISVTNNIEPIKETIIKKFCYNIFWERWAPLKLHQMSLAVIVEGNSFLAWVDDVIRVDETHEALLLKGVIEGGTAYIEESESYALGKDSVKTTSYYSRYFEARRPFEISAVIKDAIEVPSNCASVVDTPTGEAKLLFNETELQSLGERFVQTDRRKIRAEWKQLGIWSEVFETDYIVEASGTEIDVGGATGKLLVLSLVGDFKSSWQYLIFRNEGSNWRYLGNIDTGLQRYSTPNFRIQRIGEQGIWFVLESMILGGTGVVDYWETWYDLKGNWRYRVLDYPAHGHLTGWGLPQGYGYQLKAVNAQAIGRKYVVDISIDVGFSNTHSDIADVGELFGKVFRARYVSDPQSARFHYDRTGSNVPEDRFQRGFTLALAPSQFVRVYFADLWKLTAKPSEGLRLWFQRFLEMCEDSSQKRALLKRVGAKLKPSQSR